MARGCLRGPAGRQATADKLAAQLAEADAAEWARRRDGKHTRSGELAGQVEIARLAAEAAAKEALEAHVLTTVRQIDILYL